MVKVRIDVPIFWLDAKSLHFSTIGPQNAFRYLVPYRLGRNSHAKLNQVCRIDPKENK